MFLFIVSNNSGYLPLHRTHLPTVFLVTDTTEDISSWKASCSQLVKKLPAISWNAKSHYHIYKRPPFVPLLIQITPVRALSSYFFKFTSVLSFHQRLGFPDGLLNQVCISLFCHTCYMPWTSHTPGCDNPNNIWWGAKIMKLFIKGFSPNSRHLIPVRPKLPPQHPILEYPQPTPIAHSV